jgi:RHS repeat-associated protein
VSRRRVIPSFVLILPSQYAYDEANELTGITYLSAINPTPNVTFAYDPYFPRRISMTDGTGTTQYSYVPAGSLGALQLQQQVPPLAGSTIAYAYDALGRLSSRTVESSGAETFGYDALGRLTSDTNDLGAFTLAYLGQTNQIVSRQLGGSTLATAWSYLPNSGDRRLSEVSTTGLSSGEYSTFQYTTDAEAQITGTTQTSDAAPSYPAAGQQTAGFNNLNQITTLENPPPSGQAYTYDADGNLLSDGTRDYSWDAENRLVGMTYPAHSGQATAFAYDGLGRRVTITDTPAGGGSPVATSYVWCGAKPCQARNSSNVVTREYYAEGEFVPGTSAVSYYYGIDNLGSVRRVFYAGGAPTYDYDPYGNPLQTTAPVTDYGYAGMFIHQASGLYLTLFRAYDPYSGRWLSRDPAGELVGGINLYGYVDQDPVNLSDQLGLWGFGFSLEATLIPPGTSTGGGAGGINLEYTSSCGWHLYNYSTPPGQQSKGFSIGAGGSVNFALGTGDWTGPFTNWIDNVGPVSAGTFQSVPGTGNYRGGSLGLGVGAPLGLASTPTNYTRTNPDSKQCGCN